MWCAMTPVATEYAMIRSGVLPQLQLLQQVGLCFCLDSNAGQCFPD